MRWLLLIALVVIGYFLVKRVLASPAAGRAPERDAVTDANWYSVLGVARDASHDDIKAAYKHRIAQYHPDKVAQLGEEIRAVAEAKTKQINAAYEIGSRPFRD